MDIHTFYILVVAVIGACWGSFLNAAYYRIEEGLSLIRPQSHCPKCKKTIKPWLNVPILGWFLSGGKCVSCKSPISLHYPIMEFLAAFGFVTCYVLTWQPWVACLLGAAFGFYGMAVIYDHKHFLLPSVALYGAMVALFFAVILDPFAVNPLLTGKPHQEATATLIFGGLVIYAALWIIKVLGELYFRKTLPLAGTIVQVSQEGITLIPVDAEKEFTPWSQFSFSKLIPQEDIKVKIAGVETELMSGDIEIFDGGVKIKNEVIDLSEGPVEISAVKLAARRIAMGEGDLLLVPSLGALVGFGMGLFEMLLIASVTGTLHGLYLRRKDRRLPFGPHLILGASYVFLSHFHVVPVLSHCLKIVK